MSCCCGHLLCKNQIAVLKASWRRMDVLWLNARADFPCLSRRLDLVLSDVLFGWPVVLCEVVAEFVGTRPFPGKAVAFTVKIPRATDFPHLWAATTDLVLSKQYGVVNRCFYGVSHRALYEVTPDTGECRRVLPCSTNMTPEPNVKQLFAVGSTDGVYLSYHSQERLITGTGFHAWGCNGMKFSFRAPVECAGVAPVLARHTHQSEIVESNPTYFLGWRLSEKSDSAASWIVYQLRFRCELGLNIGREVWVSRVLPAQVQDSEWFHQLQVPTPIGVSQPCCGRCSSSCGETANSLIPVQNGWWGLHRSSSTSQSVCVSQWLKEDRPTA